MEDIEMVSLELLNEIRDQINEIPKRPNLQSNRKQWLCLTSAIMSLEDSTMAISHYCKFDYPASIEGRYLYLYGLLQAIFLQQDAIAAIYLSLFKKKIIFQDEYPEAYEIREIRNDVVGHPTNRNAGSEFIFLTQIALNQWTMSYLKHTTQGDAGIFKAIDIDKAISDNSKAVNTLLEQVAERLKDERRKYLEKFRDVKMADIFKALDYAREKVFHDQLFKTAAYSSTKKMIGNLESELRRRFGSEKIIDSYGQVLKRVHELFHAIDEDLYRLPPDLHSKFEYYLFENLFAHLDKLRLLCIETDDEFNEPFSKSDCEENDANESIQILIDGQECRPELLE